MDIKDDDVITFTAGSVWGHGSLFYGKALKASFADMIKRACSNDANLAEKVINEGVEFKMLKPGHQWQQARLKITMEIMVEKNDSNSLDEFRELDS